MNGLQGWRLSLAPMAALLLAACAQPNVAQPPWYAGDTHIHGHGCGGSRSPQQLLDLMGEAGLSVASALVWGQGYEDDVDHFTGDDSPVSTPERILHYDLEVSAFPSDATGHLVALGLKEIRFPRRPYGLPITEWAAGQGALVGMAHAQNWPAGYGFPEPDLNVPYEFPIDLALGTVHFLETERLETDRNTPAPGFQFLWTTLLNSGFKVPITGASDFPCFAFPALDHRTVRTYAWVEGPLSYTGWLDAIRRGRTVVAEGASDFLTMTVNGVMIGGEVSLPKGGGTIEVEIEASLDADADVTLVLNGNVAATQGVPAGPGQKFSTAIAVEESSWIAARAPRVQTGATYILVGGRPIRASQRDAEYYVGYIDYVTAIIDQGAFLTRDLAPEERRSEVDQLKRRYNQAREVFEQRASEALAR